MGLSLLLSFFISICYVLFASAEKCGNGAMSTFQSQIYRNILTNVASRNPNSNDNDNSIPVTFVMATTAEIDLGKLLDDANSAFEKTNINFYPYDTLNVDYIQYYHLGNDKEGIEEGKAFRKAYHHFYSLNVYIVDTLVGLQGTAPYCGINEDYYGFANWVILSNSNGGIDTLSNSFTFIHELGHHFCLLHTHHGKDDNDEDCVFKGDEVEFVDGTDCDSRGDLLCDTPADPNLSQEGLVNSACMFDNSKCKNRETFDMDECLQTAGDVNGDEQTNILDIVILLDDSEYTNIIDYCSDNCNCEDALGHPYVPDTGNYMSYTRETCGDHFSLMQQNIILMQYDGYEKDRYLDCTGDFMGASWSCAGCMEQTACNYNSDATIEDYSCELPIEGYNCNGEELFNNSKIIPANFLLSIYPNPFNPITTISFTIREFGFTTITAYNITGRKLQTLINEVLGVGNYSINWNASSYPSGVYLIRMDNGKFTLTQKVVLIK